MNYSTDRPINTMDKDLLGRSYFSKGLGTAIYNYKGKDGLVIALFGKWGTGKTSILNMAINEIENLSKKDISRPIIVKFSPWNYTDQSNLISIFFQTLKNSLNIQGNESNRKKLGKAFTEYSDALDVLPFIPSGVAKTFKFLFKSTGKKLAKDVSLEESRKKLENELIKANNKIIIIIDDIDRLTSLQIRDIFQLVKQVADFPNVIYVLSMDREVVCEALKELQNIDGDSYLEKIIQVPFEVPVIKKTKLEQIFFDNLNLIINQYGIEISLDGEYWGMVFENCISPYIKTLRDVSRVSNVLQFKWSLLYQEISFEDLVAITTLEVLEPELYKWIINNKDVICGGISNIFSLNQSQVKYNNDFYYNEFMHLNLDPDLLINCVATMFPKFNYKFNKFNHGNESSLDVKRKMRIADPEKFTLYFMLDLDDVKVSRSIINECVYEFDIEELITAVRTINIQGDIIYFLRELESLIENIPYERLSLIIEVLLMLQGSFIGEKSSWIIINTANEKAEYIIYKLVQKLKTDTERYRIIRLAIENINKDSLGYMALIINRIELSYGRLAGTSEKQEDQIISLTQLEEIENVYIDKLLKITEYNQIFDIEKFSSVLYLWGCFDTESLNQYLEEQFKDDMNKLKFICAVAGRFSGIRGRGWGWDPHLNSYSKYISDDDIYHLILNLDKQQLKYFSEVDQIKLASFVLNYNKDIEDVTENEARKLVNEWLIE